MPQAVLTHEALRALEQGDHLLNDGSSECDTDKRAIYHGLRAVAYELAAMRRTAQPEPAEPPLAGGAEHLLRIRLAGRAEAADRLVALLEAHPERADAVLTAAHDMRRVWVAGAEDEYTGAPS